MSYDNLKTLIEGKQYTGMARYLNNTDLFDVNGPVTGYSEGWKTPIYAAIREHKGYHLPYYSRDVRHWFGGEGLFRNIFYV